MIKDLKFNLLGLSAVTALNLAVRLDSAYITLVEGFFLAVFTGLGNLGELYTQRLLARANDKCVDAYTKLLTKY